MKPNFFIIGAPKCGTTTLAHWLSQTPSVFMSDPKEPHYYSPDYLQAWSRTYDPRRDDYEALFDQATDAHVAVGEASTNYLWSKTAVGNILTDVPDARFIVCLRNPVDMARSLHGHLLFWGHEVIADFEAAWRAQQKRNEVGEPLVPWFPNPQMLQYGDYCSTGTQLERAVEIVDKDRLHVVLIDDLAKTPEATYRGVIDFLRAEAADINYRSQNKTRQRRSNGLHHLVRKIRHGGEGRLPANILAHIRKANERWNVKDGKTPALSAQFRRELTDYFKEEVEKLEQITGKDLSAWKQA